MGVDPRRGPEGEREDRAGQQLGRRPHLVVGQEAPQVRPAEGVGHVEHAVEPVEGEVGQDELGLVGEHDAGHLVVERQPQGGAHADDEQVLERGRGLQLGAPLLEQAPGPVLEEHLDDAVLPSGEHPVGGGPADAGLAGDVVERRLPDARARHAAHRGLDQRPVCRVRRRRRRPRRRSGRSRCPRSR